MLPCNLALPIIAVGEHRAYERFASPNNGDER